jgi:peptide deformylase
MFLPISKLPAQVLRNPVEEVVFPLDKKMKRLLMDMLDTVQSAEGIGLAATQVGKSLNLALIFLAHQGKEPFFICNPKIIKTSRKEKGS